MAGLRRETPSTPSGSQRSTLHLEQEVPAFVGKSRISVFADIENLPNLINHNWGEQLRNFFPYTDVVTKVTLRCEGA